MVRSGWRHRDSWGRQTLFSNIPLAAVQEMTILENAFSVRGPVFVDNSTSEIYSTISAFAESRAKQSVLWAGTDDGNLQVSFNGGGKWSKVPPKLKGARVSHVEPSRGNAMVAYASLERHMLDDLRPYVYKTVDGGQSWAPDKAFVWTVREGAIVQQPEYEPSDYRDAWAKYLGIGRCSGGGATGERDTTRCVSLRCGRRGGDGDFGRERRGDLSVSVPMEI